MTRHEAREQAFLLLFDKSFHPELDLPEIINLAGGLLTDLSLSPNQDLPDILVSSEDASAEPENEPVVVLNDFTKNLVESICADLDKIDSAIEENLRGWKMNRISRVSLSVLRLAIGELLYTDAPAGVVVNEAVELVKQYAAAEDVAFVNGTLRNYLRKKEAE